MPSAFGRVQLVCKCGCWLAHAVAATSRFGWPPVDASAPGSASSVGWLVSLRRRGGAPCLCCAALNGRLRAAAGSRLLPAPPQGPPPLATTPSLVARLPLPCPCSRFLLAGTSHSSSYHGPWPVQNNPWCSNARSTPSPLWLLHRRHPFFASANRSGGPTKGDIQLFTCKADTPLSQLLQKVGGLLGRFHAVKGGESRISAPAHPSAACMPAAVGT